MLLLGVGLGEDQRDAWRGCRARSTSSLPFEHPAAVGLARARLLVGGVGAGVGLGRGRSSRATRRSTASAGSRCFCSSVPQLQDRRADERGLDRDHRPHRRVARPISSTTMRVGHVVEPGAAVLARHDRAQVALVGDLRHELGVEVMIAVVLARALDDLAVGELARGLADQLLLVGQVEVHGPTLLRSTRVDVVHRRVRRTGSLFFVVLVLLLGHVLQALRRSTTSTGSRRARPSSRPRTRSTTSSR